MLTFQVKDMTCGRCAQALATALAEVAGISEIDVDIGGKLVQVSGEATAAQVAAAIRDAGYTPQALAGAPASGAAPARGGCCGGRKAATQASDGSATAVRHSCFG